MSQAYTPGLKVARRVAYRARRFLPIAGEVLASPGERVTCRDVVARTLLPGPIVPVNVAQLLAVPAAEVPQGMCRQVGESLSSGELLARSAGIFGWFRAECAAPSAGVIESISSVTGQVLLRGAPQRVELRAYLTGQVAEVFPQTGVLIDAEVTLIQGIFGIGGEAYGTIRLACSGPDEELTENRIFPAMAGMIVVGGARVTAAALSRGVECGVSAIVSGGIDDQDLRDFLGYDLGVATTGSEQVGLTLIITEGFGEIAMARQTYELLALRAGAEGAVNGATQIRAGVVRPEIVIPWVVDAGPSAAVESMPEVVAEAAGTAGILQVGSLVRIIRDPYFGIIGTVSLLPSEPQRLGSGSRARVVEVRLAAEERVIVPRANVELVEH